MYKMYKYLGQTIQTIFQETNLAKKYHRIPKPKTANKPYYPTTLNQRGQDQTFKKLKKRDHTLIAKTLAKGHVVRHGGQEDHTRSDRQSALDNTFGFDLVGLVS